MLAGGYKINKTNRTSTETLRDRKSKKARYACASNGGLFKYMFLVSCPMKPKISVIRVAARVFFLSKVTIE
jgi:hypothetical protein